MSEARYCSQDDSESTVTIFFDEPITVKFNKPPIIIKFSESTEVFLHDSDAGTSVSLGLAPPDIYYGMVIDRKWFWCEGGVYHAMLRLPSPPVPTPERLNAEYYGAYVNFVEVPFHSITYDDTTEKGYCVSYPRFTYTSYHSEKTILWVSDLESFYFWECESMPNYKVLCDGCKPEECKGGSVKYPGHICLDCKDLEERLDRIGRKLDGRA